MCIRRLSCRISLFIMVALNLLSTYAMGQETLGELLNETRLDDYSGLDLVVEDDITVAQNKSFQLSVEHQLAVNSQMRQRSTHQLTDFRLSSEAPLGLLGYAQVELKAVQYWQAVTTPATVGQLSVPEVERLVLQYSLAEINLKLGRYLLNWGEVEGAGVLDVINPAPTLNSMTKGYTPQWLLSGSYYRPAGQLSWFVGLKPSVAKIPEMPLHGTVPQEWGAQYSHTGAASDWAVYLGHMVPNSPVVNLAQATASAKAYQLIGYSWNKAHNNDLFKFDIAYKRGLEHNLGYTGLRSDHRLDMALGLELKAGARQWDLTAVAKHWLNYQSSYLTPATLPVASHRTDINYSLGVKDSFNNAESDWSLVQVGTPSGSLRALTGELGWAPTDPWRTSLNYTLILAKSNSVYASLDDTRRLTLKTKFSY